MNDEKQGFLALARTEVLAAVAHGEIDLNRLAREVLANRGMNINAEKDVISSAGRILKAYVEGSSGFEQPYDCGVTSKIGQGE